MPRSLSKKAKNKTNKEPKQSNKEEKDEETIKKKAKKENKSKYKKINKKKEEISQEINNISNQSSISINKGKSFKLSKGKNENEKILTERGLRRKSKSKNDIKENVSNKKKEKKEQSLIKINQKKTKILKKCKTNSKSKRKRNNNKEFENKEIDEKENSVNEQINKMVEKIEEKINSKNDNKMDEEENEESQEENKQTINSIGKLKKTISSKSFKYKKINEDLSNCDVQNLKELNKSKNNNENKTKNNKKKKINPKKIKEMSSECDAEESLSSFDQNMISQKDDYLYNSIDSQRISKEVEEVIKRIEKRKKGKQLNNSNNLSNKKRNRSPEQMNQNITRGTNHTAEEYNFVLQKNPNIKNVTPYIDLEELSNNSLIKNTDILLAILEIGSHSNSYLFAYSSKSKMFWNDVLQYKILKKIFKEFKAETLRKYWNELSKYNSIIIFDLITKNKEYLDKIPSIMKLGTIVNTISKILNGKITDFKKEEGIPKNKNKTKHLKEANTKNNIHSRKKKFEPDTSKEFNENNINIIGLQEVYHKNEKLNESQYTMDQLFEEENDKTNYLKGTKNNKKIIIDKVNQHDKFIFKSIDIVLEALCKEFNNYSKEYILDILKQNSMNIEKTYVCLKEPMKAKIIGYTPLDDKIILKMKKGEEFNNLLREKGKKSILEREEYLSN